MRRVLLIEDDRRRYAFFAAFTPPDIRLVWAKSAGGAMALLEREESDTYAGILLDYDLHEMNYTPSDKFANGGSVASVILRKVDACTPVLVHSMNATGGGKVTSLLEGAGFPVTRIPFADLTAVKFTAWLEQLPPPE